MEEGNMKIAEIFSLGYGHSGHSGHSGHYRHGGYSRSYYGGHNGGRY
jgi:hypothetical protein